MEAKLSFNTVSILLAALLAFSGGGCKSGNTRSNEQDTATATAADAKSLPASNEPEVFAEGYTPPAGIKYRPAIVDEGALRLDVEAALKNTRPFPVSNLGGGLSYRVIGDFENSSSLYILPVDEGYLACGFNGLWLLDKEMNLERMLFRSNIKVEEHDGRQMIDILSALFLPYDDRSSGLIRFYCAEQDEAMKKMSGSIVTLSKSDLLAAAEPLTPADIRSKLPVEGGGWGFPGSFMGMEGGYAKPRIYTNDLFTFGLRGDTLCRFTLGEEVDYTPKSTHRTGEMGTAYYQAGRTIFRPAYGNTFYHLKDASTVQALYTLDFGSLHRATGMEVVGGMGNVDDGYFVSSWLETDTHIFMQIDRGYDTPNARDAKSVVLHAMVYNKQTRDFFSLPLRTDKVDYPVIGSGLKDSFPFWPTHLIDGKPAMLLSGRTLKMNYPEQMQRNPALKDVKAGEMVLISIGGR